MKRGDAGVEGGRGACGCALLRLRLRPGVMLPGEGWAERGFGDEKQPLLLARPDSSGTDGERLQLLNLLPLLEASCCCCC